MITAPATAAQPISGSIRKQIRIWKGRNGRSEKAAGPPLEMKLRIWSRSRSGCRPSPGRALRSGSVTTALNTFGWMTSST